MYGLTIWQDNHAEKAVLHFGQSTLNPAAGATMTARTGCAAHGIDFGLDLLLGHEGSFDCGDAFRRFEKFIRRAAADFLAQELLDFRAGEQARLRGFLGEMPGSDCWRRVGMLRWPSKWLSQRNQP
jgi:hypothetical protein